MHQQGLGELLTLAMTLWGAFLSGVTKSRGTPEQSEHCRGSSAMNQPRKRWCKFVFQLDQSLCLSLQATLSPPTASSGHAGLADGASAGQVLPAPSMPFSVARPVVHLGDAWLGQLCRSWEGTHRPGAASLPADFSCRRSLYSGSCSLEGSSWRSEHAYQALHRRPCHRLTQPTVGLSHQCQRPLSILPPGSQDPDDGFLHLL